VDFAAQHRDLQMQLFEREEQERAERRRARRLQELIDEPDAIRWCIYYEGEAAFWSWYETVKESPQRLKLIRNRLAELEAHAQRIANEKADGEKSKQEAQGQEEDHPSTPSPCLPHHFDKLSAAPASLTLPSPEGRGGRRGERGKTRGEGEKEAEDDER
jgi:hypothetical protein